MSERIAGLLAILHDRNASAAACLAAGAELGASDPRLDGACTEIPEGEFLRGSPPDRGTAQESPQRRVTLSAFGIERMPVTVAQFQGFIDDGGYRRAELWSAEGYSQAQVETWRAPRFHDQPEWSHVNGPNQPVVGVSWYEAEAYCRWAGRRLPTEAEWERAARGDEGRIFPWGDEFDPAACAHRGVTGSEFGARAAPPVGCFPRGISPWGLLDCAGTVWEWCADGFDPGFYARAPERDPVALGPFVAKVARGGAWNAMPLQCRTANRNAWRPTARFSNVGFRCAVTPRGGPVAALPG